MSTSMSNVLLALLGVASAPGVSNAVAAEYPVAFLAAPKTTGFFKTHSVSEQNGPYVYHEGTDLVVRKADGMEEVLVAGSRTEGQVKYLAVHDFCVSIDGRSILYAHVLKHTDLHSDYVFCDLFRITLADKKVVQLTSARSEFSPPTGSHGWRLAPLTASQTGDQFWPRPYLPTWNVSPCECGDGSIVFTSNRSGVKAPKELYRAMQLYRMDEGGKNVEKIGHLNLAGAAHPTIAKSGRVWWSSAEQQGYRGGLGTDWGIWSINPDGTEWGPEVSAFDSKRWQGLSDQVDPRHFQTETTDGSIAFAVYYDTRVYGNIFVAPPFAASPFGPPTMFGSKDWRQSVPVQNHWNPIDAKQQAFQRRGERALTGWATSRDIQNVLQDGSFGGMISHPAAIPGNGILLTWTGNQGDANMDLGIYAVPDIAVRSQSPGDLTKVVDEAGRHEWLARPVVPLGSIYGLADDWRPPTPAGAVATELPEGSPFGIVGTSSVSWFELGSQGASPDGASENPANGVVPSEIEYVRILSFNPTTAYAGLNYPAWVLGEISPQNQPEAKNREGFHSQLNERAGYYEQLVPVKKYRQADGTVHYGPNPPEGATVISGPDGQPDTSVKFALPADQPWTFQTLNAAKEAVFTAQTWHQSRPREKRVNCGGCHAHNQPFPTPFEETFAASAEYAMLALDRIKTVEWFRDIKPIADAHGVDLGPEPWKTAGQVYKSKKATVPASFSEPEKELFRAWIDTGLMAAGRFGIALGGEKTTTGPIIPSSNQGPYADAVPPTLAVMVRAGRVLIGATDPQSGLNPASLSVKVAAPVQGRPANAELADLATFDEATSIWTLPISLAVGDVLTVSIRDRQKALDHANRLTSQDGNLTRVVRTVRALSQPKPPLVASDEQLQILRGQIASLQSEVSALQAEQTANRTEIHSLQSKLDGLKSAWHSLKTALDD